MLDRFPNTPPTIPPTIPPNTLRSLPGSLRLLFLLALLATPLLAPAAHGAQKPLSDAAEAQLARAEERLEVDDPEGALELLGPLVKKYPHHARPWMVRSTARVMLGEVTAAREDLERALELDPGLRRGWLHLGAVALAQERHGDALAAFRKAEELDPGAADNHLNIGAVLLLQGRLEEASERFSAYLAAPRAADGTAYYLVATNYAQAGYAALAVQHLRRAIELEERLRISARSDGSFSRLRDHPQFQELLSRPPSRPSAASYVSSRTFETPYQRGRGALLKAVLDTLQLQGIPFDSQVEVTPGWSLVWGPMRILVSSGEKEGQGRVEVSAEMDEFSPTQWRQQVRSLFEGIERQLLLRTLK